jgi:uncharacterized protein (DUF1697 family)
MLQIRKSFTEGGFTNISSYKQSGNILFESDATPQFITATLENAFQHRLGKPITVFARTVTRLSQMITCNPFHTHMSPFTNRYVTFIHPPVSMSLDLPVISPTRAIEIIQITPSEIFSLSRKRKERYGYPTAFVESRFNVTATTRNWITIQGIVQTAQS